MLRKIWLMKGKILALTFIPLIGKDGRLMFGYTIGAIFERVLWRGMDTYWEVFEYITTPRRVDKWRIRGFEGRLMVTFFKAGFYGNIQNKRVEYRNK
jgi:hypothetical protein